MTDSSIGVMAEFYLPLSALSHYRYCPRRCALVHTEQSWTDNSFTQEGNILHERVDSGVSEQRRSVRYERAVSLISHRLHLTGKMDLLEIESGEVVRYFPVEYKRGKAKVEDWDRIQLCAQALCLEEMRDALIAEGAIWHAKERRREAVVIDDGLRRSTIEVIEKTHALMASGITPAPTKEKGRCRACSLNELCGPHTFARDMSSAYIDQMYLDAEADAQSFVV